MESLRLRKKDDGGNMLPVIEWIPIVVICGITLGYQQYLLKNENISHIIIDKNNHTEKRVMVDLAKGLSIKKSDPYNVQAIFYPHNKFPC